MEVVFDTEEIEVAISEVAEKINSFYSKSSSHFPVVTIPVLKGGMFFYVDLAKKLEFPMEVGVVSTSHYPNGEQVNSPVINFIDAQIKGRDLLLVDEICYTGKTLEFLKQHLFSLGAASVKTVCLIDQPNEHKDLPKVLDWSAITYYGNDWLWGYGMDLKGLHRNTTKIYK